jgi:hypothetical protein
MKIAFKLSTPEAVEYANGHREQGKTRYGKMEEVWFHLPKFDWRHNSFTVEPGYTDVTPNFLEDYYRPWKDKLANPFRNEYAESIIEGAKEIGRKVKHDVETADKIYELYKELPDCPLKEHLSLWFSLTPKQ